MGDDDHQGVGLPGIHDVGSAGARSHFAARRVRGVEHEVPWEMYDLVVVGIPQVVVG
jgi:hypothetical protein